MSSVHQDMDELVGALQDNRVIRIAVGLQMERHGRNAEQVDEMLREQSRHQRETVLDVMHA